MALSVELNQAHRWFVAECVRRIIEFYHRYYSIISMGLHNVANSGEASFVREL